MGASEAGNTIGLNSIIVATKDQVATDLAGETILLSLDTAMYYGLDEVGARILELAREPTQVAKIRDTIASEYDVALDRCERDVIAFLGQLADQKLIEVRNGASPA